jgi:hypothetical protein
LLILRAHHFLWVFNTYSHHVLSPTVRINAVNLERRRYLVDEPNSERDNAIMYLYFAKYYGLVKSNVVDLND